MPGNPVLVVRQVLEHLVECPEAVDTAAGIRQWWLDDEELTDSRELEKILDAMVEQGWLVGKQAGSSATLYGVNDSRMDEIRSFLGHTM